MTPENARPKTHTQTPATTYAVPAALLVITAASFIVVIGNADPASAWLPALGLLLLIVIWQMQALLRR